jgi:hypothetical protein
MAGLKQFIFLLSIIPLIGSSQNDSIYTKKINKKNVIHQCFNKKTKKPMIFPDYSYGLYTSAIVSVSDGAGNSEMSFRDTLGNQVCDFDSIYVYKTTVSKDKRNSEWRYYYQNNVEARNGTYQLYDNRNRILESGEIRMNDTVKINFWKTTYNKKGNTISEIYYKNRNNIGETDDYSIAQYYYDKHGNITGYAFRDHNGKLTAFEDNYARVVYTYNKNNKLIEAAWFNRDSLPTTAGHYKCDYSKIVFEYDSKKRLSQIKLLTQDDKPGKGALMDNIHPSMYSGKTYYSDSYVDFSRKVFSYGAFGNIIAIEYLDRSSERISYTYYHYFLWFYRGESPKRE